MTTVEIQLTASGHVNVYTGQKLVATLYGPNETPVDRLALSIEADAPYETIIGEGLDLMLEHKPVDALDKPMNTQYSSGVEQTHPLNNGV